MVIVALALVMVAVGAAAAGEAPPGVAGLPQAEAMRLGERMYREGILPGGEPMQAITLGDIAVDGRMFICNHCHRRSGLGSVEGRVVTWPTNGKNLYQPRRRTGAWRPPADAQERTSGRRALPPQLQGPDARPAYTDETLARLLQEGVDPAGRPVDPAMPRYALSDRDMAILIDYLKNLSNEISPGVDEKTLGFATVVADGVPREDREAMLAVLQAHVDAHNSQYRHQERRAQWGPFHHSEKNQRYRGIELSRWELKGPRETWRSQLEAYYRAHPVFGLLGGIATGSWAPIHGFCEENKLPCLFPITDQPVVSETDWYTLYFSKGLYQEGEGAAAYLHRAGDFGPEARIVQVFRQGGRGAAVARGFRETWETLGGPAPTDRELDRGEAVSERLWNDLAESTQPAVLLLWLEEGALEALSNLAKARSRPRMIFVASSLLGDQVSGIPEPLRETLYLTYPYSLPGENTTRQVAVERYLRSRNIPVTNLAIQSKMVFLGNMVSKTLRMIRSEFYRDYFLEKLEMMADQESNIAVYPRLTFGPNQRYASKGCYIVQLTPGPNPELIKRSDWVTH